MKLFRLAAMVLLAFSLMAAQSHAHSTLSHITQGSEEKITLPAVPGSKLIIHATKGIDKTTDHGTVQSLPLAVFLTRMSPGKAVAWYRQNLPDFTVLRSGKHVQILERASDDTHIDGPETYLTPNIRIQPTDARTATHMEGARTMLQVYYRPAPQPEPGAATDGEP